MNGPRFPFAGDLWYAPEAIENVLTIPDPKHGRIAFNIPKHSVFTLVKQDGQFWWVVTFNGFTPWTSIQTLIDLGHLKLLRSCFDYD